MFYINCKLNHMMLNVVIITNTTKEVWHVWHPHQYPRVRLSVASYHCLFILTCLQLSFLYFVTSFIIRSKEVSRKDAWKSQASSTPSHLISYSFISIRFQIALSCTQTHMQYAMVNCWLFIIFVDQETRFEFPLFIFANESNALILAHHTIKTKVRPCNGES